MPNSETLIRKRVGTLARGVELAKARYENGYSDYLEVLDTERSLFSAQLQLASARGDYQRALVNLYRALGGDWIVHAGYRARGATWRRRANECLRAGRAAASRRD